MIAENIIPIRGNQQMNSLPDPLTPADADLTAFEWAEFNSHRMQRSDLWIDSTGDEFKAWFALWMYAQHEKPAGTLPNNDRRLSRTVATAGVDDWQSVKQMAMHGWILCSDDRYHHPVVAEAVKRAWDRRLDYLSQLEDAKSRKQAEREKRRKMIAAIREAGAKAEWNETTAALTVKFEALTNLSQASHAPVTVTSHNLSRTCHAPVTPKTETETETETETGIINTYTPQSSETGAAVPPATPSAVCAEPPLPAKPSSSKKPKQPAKTVLPENFGVSHAVQAWAVNAGHGRMQERLDHFRNWATAKGARYADWDAAFRNAIAGDWAGLNGKGVAGRQASREAVVAENTARAKAMIFGGTDYA